MLCNISIFEQDIWRKELGFTTFYWTQLYSSLLLCYYQWYWKIILKGKALNILWFHYTMLIILNQGICSPHSKKIHPNLTFPVFPMGFPRLQYRISEVRTSNKSREDSVEVRLESVEVRLESAEARWNLWRPVGICGDPKSSPWNKHWCWLIVG